MDLRDATPPSPRAGPAHRSQNIMEANKPARQTVTVLLVITFLQGCLLLPLLLLFPYSGQSLLPNPGSPLSLHAPSPWHLLQWVVGVGGKLFLGLVFFLHPLEAFPLQPVQTHHPLAPPSAQGFGFSLHAAGNILYILGCQCFTQILSGPLILT